ncbi:MAG TPA: hypothetical protein VLG16_03935 [Candidatus Saccharimonadales bacterium]|nr:hypothetical protein [Candidatus Saccharimonadales bacterium]
MRRLFFNQEYSADPVWHAQATLLLAVALQVGLPDTLTLGPRYLVAALEFLLIVSLSFTTPHKKTYNSRLRRTNVLTLAGAITAVNGYGLYGVLNHLLHAAGSTSGRELIVAGIKIYMTNIIIFGLWYWEMDGGGPGRRRAIKTAEQDFLFPQYQDETYGSKQWSPTYIDYLYLSSTNAMAFSPTDTMPLSRRAKMLMLLQASVSLLTIAVVAARAVNILT